MHARREEESGFLVCKRLLLKSALSCSCSGYLYLGWVWVGCRTLSAFSLGGCYCLLGHVDGLGVNCVLVLSI